MWDKFRITFFQAVSWMARFVLLGLATIWPWWYGGAQWQSQGWLVVGGFVLTLLTWLATCLSPRRTGACVQLSFIMVAFMLWTSLQLVPLPQFLSANLSGAQGFVQAVTRSSPVESEQLWLQAESYRSVSIAPYQTKASLAVLAVAVVVLWSSSVLILQKRWVVALAATLVLGGVFNAGLGLYQVVNWSHWTLLDLPKSGTTFATFVSRNSAPAYYASVNAAAIILMGVIFTNQRRARRKGYRLTYPGASMLGRLRNRLEDVFIDLNSSAIICLLTMAFMLIVTLATFSRGGILACLTGCAVTLCLTLGSRGAGFFSAVALAGSMLVVVSGVLSFLELDQTVYTRIDAINTSIQAGNDPRWMVWRYTAEALSTYGLAGCGLGTFRFALQPFHLHGPNVWFHHAENVPLEVFLETGLPGMLLAGWAVYVVLRQLLVHCHLQKENLLLPGVIFATCALGIQSLVDFSLFLPGVFVPYCALLGACLGRNRRIENELERLDEYGVDETDQRTQSKLPPRAPSPGKIIGHSLVALSSLSCMLIGLPSLSGYSVAGALQDELNGLESQPQNDLQKEEQYQRYADKGQDLQTLADRAANDYGGHPEVSLLIGQIEQHLWRVDATNAIDWGEGLPLSQRWDLANPQLLSLVLRLEDASLIPLQNRIRGHELGMALSQDSANRMHWALAACPQDARAAWGLLVADCQLLSKPEHAALLELLSRVIGNNTQVMVEVAVIAIQEGNVQSGVAIFKRALENDWSRMNQPNLAAIVRSLTADQLIAMLPNEIAKQALVVELLDRLSRSTTNPIPETAQLADQLAKHTYELMSKAQGADSKDVGASDAEEYRMLAAVAKRNHDLPLQIKMLQQLVLFNPNDLRSRFELYDSLRATEMGSASTRELGEILKRNTDPNTLIAYASDDPIDQMALCEQLGLLSSQTGTLTNVANSFRERLLQNLVQQMRIVQAENVEQSRQYVGVARKTGDHAAIARQLAGLVAFSPTDFAIRLELAKTLKALGENLAAIDELKAILTQSPPQSVRTECEKHIKNWTNP